MDQLMDLTPDTPARSCAGVAVERRLRDLWVGGMPLSRAAAAAGLPFDEAGAVLAGLGFEPGPPTRRDAAAKLRSLVEEGLSTAEVARRLGLTEGQVRRRMVRAGLPVPPKVRRSAAVEAEAARLYEAGRSIRAVAAELGIHHRDVWRHLCRAGVARRPRVSGGVVLSKRQLEQLYVQRGLSLAEVARRFEVSPDVVARNLDRYGIPRHRPPLDRATLERLYVDGQLGIRALSARLGVAEAKVRADLAHHGIPVRRPGRPAQPADGA